MLPNSHATNVKHHATRVHESNTEGSRPHKGRRTGMRDLWPKLASLTHLFMSMRLLPYIYFPSRCSFSLFYFVDIPSKKNLLPIFGPFFFKKKRGSINILFYFVVWF